MSDFPKLTFYLNEACFEGINEMLRQAYCHGGDSGGPYGSNEKGLAQAMRKFLKLTGAKYVIVRAFGGCLQFAKLCEEDQDDAP